MPWRHHPALRFAALGVALFVVKTAFAPDRVAPRPLRITEGRLEQMRAAFERANGRLPGPLDERVLLDRAVEEEILYREAVSRGLDSNNPSIAFRLTEKMRFIAGDDTRQAPIDPDLHRQARRLGLDVGDPIVRRIAIVNMRLLLGLRADETPPIESELREHYEQHRSDYEQAARVSFWHLFLGPPADDHAEREAARLCERLRNEKAPPAAVRLGKPSPLGSHLRGQSARDLGNAFGGEFAAALMEAAPRRWFGPVRSAQGLHLVWLEERRSARVPPFEAVRPRVLAELKAERRQARVRDELERMRSRYVVLVGGAPEDEKS